MSRYSRQEILLGNNNQMKLQQAKIAIVGIGALGTVSAELLARSGVNELLLIDRDLVELSNLQRQNLFDEKDLGNYKVETAKIKLNKINSSIKINTGNIHLNKDNIDILNECDLVLDCTDNLQTRFLINDYCKKNNLPWVYSAAIKNSGYVFPIIKEGPCLQCFIKEPTHLETCSTVGVINTITTSIAALQVTLAIKMILQEEIEPILYHYNIWNQEFKKLKINKNVNCKSCNGSFDFLDNVKTTTIKFCAAGKYQIQGNKINRKEMKLRWQKLGNIIDDGITLRLNDIMLFNDGRAIIKANSEQEAQTIYSKYVGN